MHRITIFQGGTIYREGEAAEAAYLILSGEVETARGSVRVKSGKGSLIGFAGLFDRPYGSTAVALSDCMLVCFSRRELRALIRSNPDEAVRILDGMIQLLGRVANELERQAVS
jgi:CRP-like cAMP-binding protein